MATPTYQELLDQAKTLMLDLLTNRVNSGSVGGRNFTYHNLSTLQSVIDYLETQVGRAATINRGPAVARFGGAS